MQAAAYAQQIPALLLDGTLMWVASGVAMLLSFGVADYLDAVRLHKIRKRGRLPTVQAEVIAVAVAILLWPKLARRVM